MTSCRPRRLRRPRPERPSPLPPPLAGHSDSASSAPVTGPESRTRALASAPGIEFAAVWGRNTEAAATLAAECGVKVHADFDAFLAEVDAVAFSVPPDVQSELAVRAARAGKHLLLEKPIALTEAEAETLATAVRV